MKGVILAGGAGSRLFPLTRATDEHLLPACSRPVNFCPLETLVDAGILEFLPFTRGQDAGHFFCLLANRQGLRPPPNHAEETP